MPVNVQHAANLKALFPPHQMEKRAEMRMNFDKALRLVVPRLTRRQRKFLASVGGFREADIFDVAMIEQLEAPAWKQTGLVQWRDSAWKRHVGRKRQMSSSYRLTEFGRLYVTSAANLIAAAKVTGKGTGQKAGPAQ